MSTPEPRFEVPPEYADVYERAYRRAYEHGLGTGLVAAAGDEPVDRADLAPVRSAPPGRGRRVAVPRQRGSDGPATPRARPATKGGSRRAGTPVSQRVSQPEPTPEPTPAPRRTGHRGVPRTGSTWVPLVGLVALALMLLAGAFVLGRVTADGSNASDAPRTATTVSTPTLTPTGSTSPTAYDGPTAPLRPDAVGAGCTASPGLSPQGVPVGYDASNVLDEDPATAWRCDATPVGQVLDFTLPRDSHVVAVGLVPGYAVTDPASGVDLYAQNNRITRVLWTFDDGSSVTQDLSPDTQDRSLRLLPVPETTSTHVAMKILSVDPGATGSTMVSTVGFEMAAGGAE